MRFGLGIRSASISGVMDGRSMERFADSQFWGRRRTLLLSALVSAIASFTFAIAVLILQVLDKMVSQTLPHHL